MSKLLLLVTAILLVIGASQSQPTDKEWDAELAHVNHWRRAPTLDDMRMPDGTYLTPASLHDCKVTVAAEARGLKFSVESACPRDHRCAIVMVDVDTRKIVSAPIGIKGGPEGHEELQGQTVTP